MKKTTFAILLTALLLGVALSLYGSIQGVIEEKAKHLEKIGKRREISQKVYERMVIRLRKSAALNTQEISALERIFKNPEKGDAEISCFLEKTYPVAEQEKMQDIYKIVFTARGHYFRSIKEVSNAKEMYLKYLEKNIVARYLGE